MFVIENIVNDTNYKGMHQNWAHLCIKLTRPNKRQLTIS